MSYAYEMDDGRELLVENDGDRTLIALASGDEGQQQSQGNGFTTGKWAKAPTLFRLKKQLLLRIETKNGPEFIGIRGSQIQSLKSEPDLGDAEKLSLKKSSKAAAMKPMAPMRPMRPMEPMKPMKPMKEMRRMRPMEMQMGDMRMSMGSGEGTGETERRYCTQCGKPVEAEDRFCGACGSKLTRD